MICFSLWLLSFAAAAAKDATTTSGIDIESYESYAEAVIQGLVSAEGAKAFGLAGVMQVASGFEKIFTNMAALVSKDETLAEKVSTFAEEFRPVSNAAHNLIVSMESHSVTLINDKLPWLETVWEEEIYEEVPDAIRDIQNCYLKELPEFDMVKNQYEALSVRANTLSWEALTHSHGLQTKQAWFQWTEQLAKFTSGGGGLACTVGAAGVATGTITVVLTPLALGFLGMAGLSVIGGGAAGAHISHQNHVLAAELIQMAVLLSEVMSEMDNLMRKQTETLIELRQRNQEVLDHTGKLEEVVQRVVSNTRTIEEKRVPGLLALMKEKVCGAFKKRVPQEKVGGALKKRVPRLLALMNETSSALVDHCKKYKHTDMLHQDAVWKALEKYGGAANPNLLS